jgi:hypothetical protein
VGEINDDPLEDAVKVEELDDRDEEDYGGDDGDEEPCYY